MHNRFNIMLIAIKMSNAHFFLYLQVKKMLCCVVVLLTMLLMGQVVGVVLSDLVSTPQMRILQLIKNFFFCGISYPDIIILLFVVQGIKISLRQLNRILKASNLFCRKSTHSS